MAASAHMKSNDRKQQQPLVYKFASSTCRPFDQKNPYLAPISQNIELHLPESDRSCRHVEFKIDSTRVRYEVGDHLGIFPTNDASLVEKIGCILDIDLNTVFKLINLDSESRRAASASSRVATLFLLAADSSKRHPFPCPCSYRTALLHYVEIVLPVKSHVLRAFAEYTTDPKEKEYLILLSSASEEGLVSERRRALAVMHTNFQREYGQFVLKERRGVVDILEHFTTCRPPIELVLELLPRLQARYYSISSSPKTNNEIVSVTAVVLKYGIAGRQVLGVCTNYLCRWRRRSRVCRFVETLIMISGDKSESDSSPIFVRKSTVRLPHRHTTPVVMIGPGEFLNLLNY